MAQPLERADLSIILQVYRYNKAVPNTPFLPAEQRWKRAKALAERGFLKRSDGKFVGPGWANAGAYFVTQAGIEAYNAALAGETTAQRGNENHD